MHLKAQLNNTVISMANMVYFSVTLKSGDGHKASRERSNASKPAVKQEEKTDEKTDKNG